MRKSIVVTIAVLMALTIALSAHARKGKGWFDPNADCYCGNCMNAPFNGTANGVSPVNPITQEEAKAKVEAYVKENFKGYSVTGVKNVDTYRGTAYVVEVKDASGNLFNFFVGRKGIKGPIHNGNFNQQLQ